MSPGISGLAGRVRARGAQERGAVLVVVSLALVALLGLAALAIDLSSFYKAQRQAQSAADAGALAAAWELPNNPTGATSQGMSVATANDPTATATVAPYNGSTTAVRVTVNATSPSFFGTLFGLTQANISATAVAGGQGTVTRGAVFAYADGGQTCSDGVNLNGNSYAATGGIQSNGILTLGTNPSTKLTTGTWGSTCPPYSGSNSAWTTPPFSASPSAYPIDYRNNLPVCTPANTYSGNITLSSLTSNTVYCALNGTMTISPPTGTNVTNVTFEAEQIVESASNVTLSGPPVTGASGVYGLLFYQSGTDTTLGPMSVSNNNSTVNGSVFAPNATLNFASNNTGSGFLEANNVNISGNSFQMTGDGPPVASSGYALLQ
jgi:Flp pilus assembly protein TadG